MFHIVLFIAISLTPHNPPVAMPPVVTALAYPTEAECTAAYNSKEFAAHINALGKDLVKKLKSDKLVIGVACIDVSKLKSPDDAPKGQSI